MATEIFTSSDQIARDMEMGVFPKQSDRTKHELAERARIYDVALTAMQAAGVTPGRGRIAAREIAMVLVPTAPPPGPEHNGGD